MMGNQQGQQPQWPPQAGQPPAWYPPNQGWGSPQQNTQYPPQWQPRTPYPQQPYQPPSQYYYPPPYQQPPPPPKKSLAWWLWVLLVIAIVLCAMCGLLGSATHSTTSATTSDVQPTDTTVPTPLTSKAAIDAQVKADIANAGLQGIDIVAGFGTNASVVEGLPSSVTSQSDQLSFVQTDCFNAQKSVWQDPLLRNIKYLDFAVITLDSQGLPSVVGECKLDLQHASKIDWNTTDAVTDWNNKVYENMTPSN